MTPNVPETYLRARRQQIVDAACSCFAQKGFHGTTMQDVCTAAGLSIGAVYNYFHSKEELITACAERSEQRNVSIIENAAQKGATALSEATRALLSVFVQEGITKEQLAQITSLDIELWVESIRNPNAAQNMHKNLNTPISQARSLVENMQSEGIINNKLDATAIAQVFASLLLGLEIQIAINTDINIKKYAEVCDAITLGKFMKNVESIGK
jgi:AcrR family transcriptional regulator